MSYSYIKNVFPDYEYSITENVFNSLKPQQQEPNPHDNHQQLHFQIEPEKPIKPGNNVQEAFENTDCENIIDHISKCSYCYKMLQKQMAIENDRIQQEEIMELVSYIVLGVFILLLIEYLKNK